MTLFLTTANQFNAEKGGRGGESLTISLLLLFFRHLNKAAAAGVYQHPQREEQDKYSPVAGGEGGKVMDAIHKKRKATYQVTFFSRFHIASVVVLMGDTSCQRAR